MAVSIRDRQTDDVMSMYKSSDNKKKASDRTEQAERAAAAAEEQGLNRTLRRSSCTSTEKSSH